MDRHGSKATRRITLPALDSMKGSSDALMAVGMQRARHSSVLAGEPDRAGGSGHLADIRYRRAAKSPAQIPTGCEAHQGRLHHLPQGHANQGATQE